MANNRSLELDLKLSTEAAKKSLTDLTSATQKALNPTGQGFANQVKALDQMKTRLDLLVGAQSKLTQQGQQSSTAYAKISSEIAGILSKQKQWATNEEQFLKILQAETAERQKAASILKGSGGSSGAGGGLGGLSDLTAGLGKLAGLAGGAALVTGELNKLGDKAKATSQIISDSGGPYDKLRNSTQQVDQMFAKLASNPGIAGFEKTKNDIISNVLGFVNGVTGGKGKNAALTGDQRTQLVGDTKLQRGLLTQQRGDLEKEQAFETEKLQHDLYAKKRDLEIEFTEFAIQNDRKKAEIERKLGDENQDNAIAKAKLTADVEFKVSNQKFAMDMAFEQRGFLQKQGDEKQLAAFAAQDRATQAAFATQDRNLQLGKTLGRNAEDFRDRLTDMARSGAGGLEYLTASRDFGKQQRRAAQDAQIEQAQANRNLGFEGFKANRDLAFKQGTEGRDFGQNQQKALAEHLIDTDVHRYQVGQQMLELEIKHTRTLRDLTIEEQQRAQDEKIGRQKLANKKSDLDFDTQFETKSTKFNQEKALRGQRQSELDFASQFSSLSDADKKKLFQSDPNLGYDYVQSQGQRGLNPFPSDASNAGEDAGAAINKAVTEAKKQASLDTQGLKLPNDKVGPGTDFDLGKGLGGIPKLPGALWDWFTHKNQFDPLHVEGSFDTGGVVPHDMVAKIHKDEIILNPKQQQMLFGGGMPIGSNGAFGANQNGAGLVGANGAFGANGHASNNPMPMLGMNGAFGANQNATAQPIQMPGTSSPGNMQPVQINVGNNSYDFSGMPDEIKLIIQQMEVKHRADLQNAVSQMMLNQMKGISQVQGYAGQFRG